MDEWDPKKRAESDDKAAATDRKVAHDFGGAASSFETTADALRTLGYGEAGAVLDKTADWAAGEAHKHTQEAQIETDAADHWRTVGHDLEGQAKATGDYYVAGAGQQAAADHAQHAATDTDRISWEAEAAKSASLEAGFQHQAAELGHDAQTAAAIALADEAKAMAMDNGE